MTDSRSDRPAANAVASDPAAALSRRQALLITFAAVLTACGGNEAASDVQPPVAASPSPSPVPGPSPSPTPGPSPSPGPTAWNVGALYLTVGTAATFDLTTTLPSGVARGGVFGVSATGSALPAGVTLSPAGILSVGSAATGDVASVIFSYSEPGT